MAIKEDQPLPDGTIAPVDWDAALERMLNFLETAEPPAPPSPRSAVVLAFPAVRIRPKR